jgi:hypothetical protein
MVCNKFCAILYVVLRYLLEVADLVLDWQFYVTVVNSNQGVEDVKFIAWIFRFAVFGTAMFSTASIAFVVIVYSKWRGRNTSGVFTQRTKTVVSVVFVVCIWLEDLPQIHLTSVTGRSTELADDVKFLKAKFTIIKATTEIILTIVQLKAWCNKKPRGWSRVLMIGELIGNSFILIHSVLLFLFLCGLSSLLFCVAILSVVGEHTKNRHNAPAKITRHR